MTQFTFSAGLEGWTGFGFDGSGGCPTPVAYWDGAAGYPGVGSVRLDLCDQNGGPNNTAPYYDLAQFQRLGMGSVYTGDAAFSFFFRIENRMNVSRDFEIGVNWDGSPTYSPANIQVTVPALSTSPWTKYVGSFSSFGTVDEMYIYIDPNDLLTSSDGFFSCWIDNVFVYDTDPTAPPGGGVGGDFRYINLAESDGNLYATAFDDGTLKLFQWASPFVTRNQANTFGAATLADLDSDTRRLRVGAFPGAPSEIFVAGLDGNNVNFQRSSNKGANFADLSAPGAGIVFDAHAGLLGANDVVVVFKDAIYQSLDGGLTWNQTSVASMSAGASGRDLIKATQMLIADAAGERYTNNLGATLFDVDDVNVTGINQIVSIPT